MLIDGSQYIVAPGELYGSEGWTVGGSRATVCRFSAAVTAFVVNMIDISGW
jgi:hypothetical protein